MQKESYKHSPYYCDRTYEAKYYFGIDRPGGSNKTETSDLKDEDVKKYFLP